MTITNVGLILDYIFDKYLLILTRKGCIMGIYTNIVIFSIKHEQDSLSIE